MLSASIMPPANTINVQSEDISSPAVPREKPIMLTSEKRMIAPGAKDAPRFKSTKPEELRRFIREMEDLWKDANVTRDAVKKSMIGKYADQDSEEEWAAFKSFEDTYTWDEFKDELIRNYPEASAAERGTPARIRQLCKGTAKVRLGDMPALYAFRRAFGAESKKLLVKPPAMSNRELVELFFSCLSDHLASAVLQYLGSNPSAAKVVSSTGLPRRPEDKYELEDVCNAALQVSENSQGMFNLMSREISDERRGVLYNSQPASETKILSEKVEEIEGEQALDKDRVVTMGKNLDSRIGNLENLMKALLTQSQMNVEQICKGDCKGGSCKTHEANNGPAQKWGGKSLEKEKCFWCGLFGHFQADCEDFKNQVRIGNVKVNAEGKWRLRDGSFIPKYPADATLKERVERHYARKPSQYYYGEYEDSDPAPSAATSVFSQVLGSSNDADKRIIAQLKAELDLRKREEALELKQKMLEQNEKKIEQTGSSTRAANVLELLGQLTDEELAAIKTAKSGFN